MFTTKLEAIFMEINVTLWLLIELNKTNYTKNIIYSKLEVLLAHSIYERDSEWLGGGDEFVQEHI